MMMTQIRSESVLITGASSGLGRELATLFARDGYGLVLVARNEQRLQEIAQDYRQQYGIRVHVIAMDLARPEAAGELYDQVSEAAIEIDILVNNAGFGSYGRFCDTDLDEERRELLLNMITPTLLSKRFLPSMVARGKGHVVNMASMAAYMPGPYMAVYFATKAFVLSLSEAIAQELRGSGVHVTAICPNVVATGFQEAAGNEAAYIGGRLRWVMSSPDQVARKAYRDISAGKRVSIPGWSNRLAVSALRLAPKGLMLRAMVPFMKGPDIPSFQNRKTD